MENESPNLAPETIEDLCRHYREAERTRALHFDTCDVRLAAYDGVVDRTPARKKEDS